MPRLGRKLAFSATVLVAVLCGAEGVARLASHALRAKERGETRSVSHEVSTGRVLLCVGDSVTYGMPGGPTKAYPQALAAAVPDLRLDVRNVGSPGSNLAQIVGTADHELYAIRGRPAAVLVLGGHNDCNYLRAVDLARRPASQATLELRQLLAYSYAWRFLSQAVIHARATFSPPDETVRPTAKEMLSCTASIREGIAAAAALAKRRGVALGIVDYPVPSRWYADPQPGPFGNSYLLDEELASQAERQHLPFFATRACMSEAEAAAGGDFFVEEGVHMRDAGYHALGVCLAPFVRGLSWSPVGGGEPLPPPRPGHR